MKNINLQDLRLSAIFSLVALSSQLYAQNEVTTPTGLALKLTSDNVIVKQKISIESDSGYVSIANYKFLGIRKTAAGDLNTFVGPNAGNVTMTGKWNTFFGQNSGKANTSGYSNLFAGSSAGAANTSGYGNTMLGQSAGAATTTGQFNTFVGNSAGAGNVTGQSNVFVGISAGALTNANGNTYVGRAAGYYNAGGSYNVAIGFGAGSGPGPATTSGSYNVFLGNQAGYNETGSNKLYIANSNTATPLIYGEFPTASPSYVGKLVFNTRVGVGIMALPNSVMVGTTSTDVSAYKMFVDGGLVTRELVITGAGAWADYVFANDYKLKSLNEVEAFIKTNGHLPNIPAAKEVEKWGINVGEMSRLQQEKIEELTLYMIEQNKKLESNEDLLTELDKKIDQISVRMEELKRRSN
ncbi:hypothetical protein LZD49_26445 [Dyadobacter sp. CY261]|uniref:hypothetical protein n=1 Tax=Dyadobacter sp. CY261 TaxID=2907203 RepID=UPI001F365F6D|nr:hypothetical protein [Dyadobacter sp. CY261]MCF0074050.1 hypothetical protein [Dyadobacter sp. CY261]